MPSYIYIYIYSFSRRFYPKRLTLHSSYSFYIFYQLLLSLGIEPMIVALLTPCSTSWATGKLLLLLCSTDSFFLIFCFSVCVPPITTATALSALMAIVSISGRWVWLLALHSHWKQKSWERLPSRAHPFRHLNLSNEINSTSAPIPNAAKLALLITVQRHKWFYE